ncbi:MAG TPA: DUF5005 domain-containing protein [Candidatus Ozemobacteraceae bacterium]|nr:DUF5005 domain-containing protein [Candidatus Ozemobacteraceae bacterium]
MSSKISRVTLPWLALHVVCGYLAPIAAASAGPVQAPLRANPLPSMDALFRSNAGWIGGDGVFSVPLGNGRILWLFSDSFVGRVSGGKRRDATMIHNAVAVQDSAAARPRIVVRRAADGAPVSFFEPPDHRGYFWLFHGLTTERGLWLFLLQVETTDAASTFGFRSVGTWLAHVSNPADDPLSWRVSMRKIPWSIFENARQPDRTLFFGSWVLRSGNDVYIYGVDERPGDRRMIVAAVSADRIGRFGDWRFLGPDGWTRDFCRCRGLVDGITTEFSVTPTGSVLGSGSARFLLIQSAGNLAPDILAREADSPFGPWSDARTVFTCLEPARRPGVFTYAAKAHPELSGPAGTIISYVANTSRFEDLFGHAWLYWPTFIRLSGEP